MLHKDNRLLVATTLSPLSGTPRYSDRLCSDRRYSDNPQSGRRRRVADCSRIGLRAVPIGKTPNQIPKIRGSTIMCWKYVVTFPVEGHPRPHQDTLPTDPALLTHLDASINAVLSMHATPRPLPISSQFLLFLHMPKRAKDVLGRPDCRLSE